MNQGRGHGDEGAGGAAEESWENERWGWAAGRDPEGQYKDGREECGDNHNVEPAYTVTKPTWDDAADDAEKEHR